MFFNHRNILKVYAVFDDLKNIYVLAELYIEEKLCDYISPYNRFSQVSIAGIIKQLLEAVQYMTENKHIDIKNIMGIKIHP